MKVAVFSTHKFEKDFLLRAAKGKHELILLEPQLSLTTAGLAEACNAVCIFVNDDGSKDVLKKISAIGIRYLVLRSAGFNHVDIKAAYELGMRAARVPEYSPYAVAEHTIALMLALNRKLVLAHNRIRDLNFSLNGLTGFDMHGKTAGIIGTGKIGRIVAEILHGFGCRIMAYDIMPDNDWASKYGVVYTGIDNLCSQSDIITLHAPLTEQTRYIINRDRIAKMKKGVMMINTSRGALVNTKDVIASLKSGQIGYLGLDVYEEERGLFFEDHSSDILQDDIIARLMTFSNVLITSHQAFLTDTALHNIAETTVGNLDCFEIGTENKNEVKP
ncbi:MAG TPA: 2-hydroxyacid dehydrogenase [Chitinophagaceae bacterium]|nr:2-hydroxyacid dehydrogenase [Chitinophagaceae bacterium]